MIAAALAAALVATGVAATGVVAPASAARPASTTVVEGEVVRLESVQDRAAMASMAVGVPVAWDIGVSADRDDGTIALALESSATPNAFRATVVACGASVAGCARGATLAAGEVRDGRIALGEQRAATAAWYRIEVVLLERAAATAALTFRAVGLGDEVASEGGAAPGPRPEAGALPQTGGAMPPWLLAAGGALLLAGALAVARRGGAEAGR